MSKPAAPLWNALASTAFFGVIAGALIVAAIYLLLLGGVHLMERFGWVSGAWAGTHQAALVVTTAVLTVPAVGVATVWMFRRALAGERALERGEEPE